MKRRTERLETTLLRKRIVRQGMHLDTCKSNYRQVLQEGVRQYRRNTQLEGVCAKQRKELSDLKGLAANGSILSPMSALVLTMGEDGR